MRRLAWGLGTFIAAACAAAACSDAGGETMQPTTVTPTQNTMPTAMAGTSATSTGGTLVNIGSGGAPAQTGGTPATGGTLAMPPVTGGTPANPAMTGGAPAAGGGMMMATAGAAQGGSAPMVDPNDPTPPWRALDVTSAPGSELHTWRPSDADPGAMQQNGNQSARVDSMYPSVGKLIVDLGSEGGNARVQNWALQQGFHSMGIDFAGIGEVPDIVGKGNDYYGDVRKEEITGEDATDTITISYSDSIVGHVTEGLKFLSEYWPEEDWGYFLTEDGQSTRWSEVIVMGYSHGASTAVRMSKLFVLWGTIANSGPRDNTCGTNTYPDCGGGAVATWFDEPQLTPVDRLFSFSGSQDSQNPEIQWASAYLEYPGDVVDITSASPPYNGSNRYLVNGMGHGNFCDNPNNGAIMDACLLALTKER